MSRCIICGAQIPTGDEMCPDCEEALLYKVEIAIDEMGQIAARRGLIPGYLDIKDYLRRKLNENGEII